MKSNDSRADICDNRGKCEPGNKKSEEISALVISHIRGYNPCITHYRRSHAPNRLYISPEYIISSMHKDCCEKFPHSLVSYSYYLGEEECESCELHSNLKDVPLFVKRCRSSYR